MSFYFRLFCFSKQINPKKKKRKIGNEKKGSLINHSDASLCIPFTIYGIYTLFILLCFEYSVYCHTCTISRPILHTKSVYKCDISYAWKIVFCSGKIAMKIALNFFSLFFLCVWKIFSSCVPSDEEDFITYAAVYTTVSTKKIYLQQIESFIVFIRFCMNTLSCEWMCMYRKKRKS